MKTKLVLIFSLFLGAISLNNQPDQCLSFPFQASAVADRIPLKQTDTVILSKEFNARLKLWSKERSSRKTPYYTSFSVQIVFDDYRAVGRINLPKDTKIFGPGDIGTVRVKLNAKTELRVGKVFDVKELGKKIGQGVIVEVIK